jgi:hypothetical protein
VVKVETSFDHVWLLRDQVDKIIAATGAGIRCPDVSILKELPKKYCVWIRGSLDQVYKASTMLNVSCDSSFIFIYLGYSFIMILFVRDCCRCS